MGRGFQKVTMRFFAVMRERKRWLAALGLCLGVGLILVVGAEIYLRRTATHIVLQDASNLPRRVESNPGFLIAHTPRGRRLIPGARVIIRNHYLSHRDIVMNINSLGFRDEEIPYQKEEGEIRILVLGDSVTWGDYLQAEEVFVERLEHYLSAVLDGRRVRVINAGVGDIGLREELDILVERGLSVQPDIVLVASSLNDGRPPWGFPGELGGRGWLRRHSLVAETLYRKLKLLRWVSQQGEARFQWVWMADLFDWKRDRESFLRLASYAKYDWGSAWEEQTWPVLQRSFERLRALSQEYEFSVFVLAFPVMYQVYAEFVEDFPQKTLRHLSEIQGFRYLDLLPMLRQARKQNLFFDHCHPRVETNDLIGREIAAFFLREML
jgi:hypothetical protein